MTIHTTAKTVALTLRSLLEDCPEDGNVIDDLFRGMTDGSEASIRSMSDVDKDCFTMSLTDGSRFKIKVEKII